MKKRKKIILFLIIAYFISINNVYSYKYYKYKNYDIYISNKYINVDNKSILIIDDRMHNDIQIINSYKINNKETQEKIIDIILDYNKKYPYNGWIRSKKSMYCEWLIHNIYYTFNYKRNRTKSVDFEKNEEFIYKIISFYLHL